MKKVLLVMGLLILVTLEAASMRMVRSNVTTSQEETLKTGIETKLPVDQACQCTSASSGMTHCSCPIKTLNGGTYFLNFTYLKASGSNDMLNLVLHGEIKAGS